MKVIATLSLLALIPECGSSYGNIRAVLLLQSPNGEIREFDLGNLSYSLFVGQDLS